MGAWLMRFFLDSSAPFAFNSD